MAQMDDPWGSPAAELASHHARSMGTKSRKRCSAARSGNPPSALRSAAGILAALRKRNGETVVGEGAPARWRLKEAAN